MGADIDQRPAALLGLIREHAPGGYSTPAHGMGFAIVDVAQFPGLAGLLQVLDLGPETVLIADGKLLAGLLPCLQHGLGVVCIVGHGLLAVDMLTGLESRHVYRAVGHVRGKHVNNFHLAVGQQVVVVLIYPGPLCSVFRSALLGPLLDNVAEGHDLAQVAVCLHGREVLLVCHDPDLQFAHNSSSYVFPICGSLHLIYIIIP